jgi:hypothetical protein
MVVGCNRDHAGTQPLNMNIGPSFFSEVLITASVDCDNGVLVEKSRQEDHRTHGGSRTRGVHDAALFSTVSKGSTSVISATYNVPLAHLQVSIQSSRQSPAQVSALQAHIPGL